MSVEVGYATADDVAALIAEPLPWRIRALAGRLDGQTIGVGGFAFPPAGGVIAFAVLTPEARLHPHALHRAGLRLMAEARRLRIGRVIVEAGDHPAAERWLLRLGFERDETAEGRIFEWLSSPRSAPSSPRTPLPSAPSPPPPAAP